MSATQLTNNRLFAYQQALSDFELCSKSDIELSQILNISTRQMRRYKDEPRFWEEVRSLRLENMRNKSGRVLKALYEGAIANNSNAAQQQKIFLTMSGYYSPKQEVRIEQECAKCDKYTNMTDEELKAIHQAQVEEFKLLIPLIVESDPELKAKLLGKAEPELTQK